MNSFASLMAISATNTRQSQQAVETALQERRRKEAQKKKEQEEREEKERQLEKRMRLKLFEEEKRQRERQMKLEEERKAKELMLQRREEEQRDALRYGPKKAAKLAAASASSSHSRNGGSKRRNADDGDNRDAAGVILTREELRDKKHKAEMRKAFHTSKRTSHFSTGYRKSGMRLPGGAVNIVRTEGEQTEFPVGGSVKDRLNSIPMTLTRLNTIKKDKRTEYEILNELKAKKSGKIIEGHQALAFDDWFGDSKKKDKDFLKKVALPSSSFSTPTPGVDSSASRPQKNVAPPPSASTPVSASSLKFGHAPPRSSKASVKSIIQAKPSLSSSRGSSSEVHASSSSHNKASKAKPSSSRQPPPPPSTSQPRRVKRPRSPSESDESESYQGETDSFSSPPKKRKEGSAGIDLSDTIWEIFGKNRDKYTSIDVMSDDEDMEADASILEREEKLSSRVAQREEMIALEEERRHEEEKRRRRKEREKSLSRGY